MRRSTRRAFSVIELLISSALLLLITTTLLVSWIMASQSWLGAFRNSTRQTALQVAFRQMQIQIEDGSAQATLYANTPATPALAVPSPWGLTSTPQQGVYNYQPGSCANPLWSKYTVYYLNSVVHSLNWLEIAISNADPAAITAVPLDEWANPTAQPLGSYCNGGSSVLASVDSFQIARSDQVMTITLTTTAPATNYGAGNTPLTLSRSIYLHN